MNHRSPSPHDGPLLGVRAALILLLAVLAGIGAGLLTYLAGSTWPTAVLAGASASGASTLFFRAIID